MKVKPIGLTAMAAFLWIPTFTAPAVYSTSRSFNSSSAPNLSDYDGGPFTAVTSLKRVSASSFEATGKSGPGGDTFTVTVEQESRAVGEDVFDPSTAGPPKETAPLDGVAAGTPEPTFYVLTAIGFVGLLAMAIRRKK